jgi:hypothetical protein
MVEMVLRRYLENARGAPRRDLDGYSYQRLLVGEVGYSVLSNLCFGFLCRSPLRLEAGDSSLLTTESPAGGRGTLRH